MLLPETIFRVREAIRSFKYEWLLLFPWLCYFPSEHASYWLSCVLFGHGFPTKDSWVKNLFSKPFRAWPSAVSYFRAHCEYKKKKIYLSDESVQSLHFLDLNLKIFYLKWKAQVMKLMLCDRKYKHEVE